MPRSSLYSFPDMPQALFTVRQSPMGSFSPPPMFCLGVFLSFAAHWFLVQIDGGIAAQIMVSVAGMTAMAIVAWLLNIFKAIPDRFSTEHAAAM